MSLDMIFTISATQQEAPYEKPSLPYLHDLAV